MGAKNRLPAPPSAADWLELEVSRAVEAAFADRAFAFTESYLYYAPGRLALACTNPAGMTIGSPERVPLGKCRTGLRAWVMERARRLPCLPADAADQAHTTGLRAILARHNEFTDPDGFGR